MAVKAESLGNRAKPGWLFVRKRVTSRRVYPCLTALRVPFEALTLPEASQQCLKNWLIANKKRNETSISKKGSQL